MLYYYDLMGLIIWGSAAKEFIREMYKSYLLPLSAANIKDAEIHSIEMSISKSHSMENSTVSKTAMSSALKRSLDLFAARTLKSKKKSESEIIKADPSILPLGHFMSNVPKFYHPDKEWFESPEYVQRTQEYKENDIIIGYYEKSGTGLRIKFKIRNPIHKMQKHKDVRMLEKGSICSSNSKEYLLDIAKRLGIKIENKINVPNLCHELESVLQINELNERKKKSNIKWFYSFWEQRPDERKIETSGISSS
jgi:hypothetical protein